jgi:hypothetical protein
LSTFAKKDEQLILDKKVPKFRVGRTLEGDTRKIQSLCMQETGQHKTLAGTCEIVKTTHQIKVVVPRTKCELSIHRKKIDARAETDEGDTGFQLRQPGCKLGIAFDVPAVWKTFSQLRIAGDVLLVRARAIMAHARHRQKGPPRQAQTQLHEPSCISDLKYEVCILLYILILDSLSYNKIDNYILKIDLILKYVREYKHHILYLRYKEKNSPSISFPLLPAGSDLAPAHYRVKDKNPRRSNAAHASARRDPARSDRDPGIPKLPVHPSSGFIDARARPPARDPLPREEHRRSGPSDRD